MYRGQHNYGWETVFTHLNNNINFSPGFVNLKPGFTCGRFVPGKLQACLGTDFASFFHRGNHRGRIYRGT